MFSQEQMQIIEEKGYPKHFDTVLHSQYKRGTSLSENNLLADLLDAATGKKVSRQFNCKTCVYELYRQAGKLYYDTIAHQAQEKLKEELKQLTKDHNSKGDDEEEPQEENLPAYDPTPDAVYLIANEITPTKKPIRHTTTTSGETTKTKKKTTKKKTNKTKKQ